MHTNRLLTKGQELFKRFHNIHLESFHLVFLGCALRRGRFRDGHVFKPFTKILHTFGQILLPSPVLQFGGGFKGEAILIDEVGVPSVLPQPSFPLLKLGAQLLRPSSFLRSKKIFILSGSEPTITKLTLTFRKYSFSSGSCPLTYPSEYSSESE